MHDPSELHREIRRQLWRAGPAGLTARELARRSRMVRRLDAAARDTALLAMIEAGECAAVRSGRTTVYVDGDFPVAPRAARHTPRLRTARRVRPLVRGAPGRLVA